MRKEKIGSRIRALRKEQNLTQVQLAEKAGITQQGLSKIEKGIREPAMNTLIKIANGLGMVWDTETEDFRKPVKTKTEDDTEDDWDWSYIEHLHPSVQALIRYLVSLSPEEEIKAWREIGEMFDYLDKEKINYIIEELKKEIK